MNSLEILINQDRKDYQCFDMLKDFYYNNQEFKNFIDEGVNTGKVDAFSEELWQTIKNQNIRGLNSFEDIFRNGYNIGGSAIVSRQLSYSFPICTLCSGILPIMQGTKNSQVGEYSWMTSNGKIYDTTLMIVIDRNYAEKLGYQYKLEYNPQTDPIYCETYEFTNNPDLKSAKRR